jgi:hypothetical protein
LLRNPKFIRPGDLCSAVRSPLLFMVSVRCMC